MNYYYKLKKLNRLKMKQLREENIEFIKKIMKEAGCFELNPYYVELIRSELIEKSLKQKYSGESLEFFFYKHPDYLQEYIRNNQIPKRTRKDFVLFEFRNLVGCLTLLWCFIFIFAQDLFYETNFRTFWDILLVICMFGWIEKVRNRKNRKHILGKKIQIKAETNVFLLISGIVVIIIIKCIIYFFCTPHLQPSLIFYMIPITGGITWGVLYLRYRLYLKTLLQK